MLTRHRGGRGIAVVVAVLAVVGVPLQQAAAAVGDLVTVAGSGTAGFTGDGGPAVAAQLDSPSGVAVDGAGRLLIVDEANHAIRRVEADGSIVTIAGAGGASGYAGDGGSAAAALLNAPRGVALRPNGMVFIADTGNHVIRDVDGSGRIATVAGTGTAGFSGDAGPAAAAQLSEPSGVAARPNGVLLIADTGNHRIRMVGTDGVISTVAGDGTPRFGGDGGQATTAQLSDPEDVAVLANGTVIVADTGNHRIRRIDHTSGIITTMAGTGVPGLSGDGGPAATAQLRSPAGLAIAADGSILVADTGNHAIRRIDPTGVITTLAGTGQPGDAADGIPASDARLWSPRAIVEDTDGSVILADTGNHRIRRIQARPDAPVFTGTTPTSPGASTRPLLLGVAEPATTVTVYADSDCSGASVTTGTAETFGSVGLTVAVPANSSTTFHATATDAAGRTSPCSTSAVTYVAYSPSPADRTPPSPPNFTAVPESPGNEPLPLWRFTVAEQDATTACRLTGPAGATMVSWAPCASPWMIDLGGHPDGEYVLEVTATDPAGNTSDPQSHTYTLDTVAPPIPVFTDIPSSPGTLAAPTWRFTVAEEDATTACRLTGPAGATMAPWAPCASPWMIDLGGHPDGEYVLEVTATDPAGNTSEPAESRYRMTTAVTPPPAVPSPPTDPQPTTDPPRTSPSRSVPDPQPSTDETAAAPVDGSAGAAGDPDTPQTPDHEHGSGDPAPVETPEGPSDAPTVVNPASTPHSAHPVGQDDAAAPKASPPGPQQRAATRPADGLSSGIATVLSSVAAATRLVGAHAPKAAFPGALFASMLGFLGVQNQIDRRDPKLALAPIDDDPDLEFTMLPLSRERD